MFIELCDQPETIIHIIHEAFDRYKEEPIPSSALYETATTITTEIEQGVRMFGGHIDGEHVAVVKVIEQEDALYFARLSVLPTAQGKGYAKEMVQFIEALALAEGKQAVTCRVRKTEVGNIQLYTKLGYSIILEEYTKNKQEQGMIVVTMHKPLHVPVHEHVISKNSLSFVQ